MKRISFWLLLQLIGIGAVAQYNLKGMVTGAGEPLPGASVIINNTQYGLSAQPDGSFTFRNLKKGEYVITTSFIGYETHVTRVTIPAQKELVIDLDPVSVLTSEVLVSGTRAGTK